MPMPKPLTPAAGMVCRVLMPFLFFSADNHPSRAQSTTVPADIVFKNATVMTASHGTIEHGSVWVHAGKIAGVGATVSAPSSTAVLDASGMWLTPGIIDPHSHSALDSDVNEATSPVNSLNAHD